MQSDNTSQTIEAQQAKSLIDNLVENRAEFDGYVYSPLEDALSELLKRQNDPRLDEYLAHVLPTGVPEAMHNAPSVVLFRHIATPNYEIRRFIMLADLIVSTWNEERQPHHPPLRTLILEYLGDKFTNRNEWKYSLGRIYLNKGKDKHGHEIFDSCRIVDFNASNNLPISDVTTFWGQSLVDFHHEAFLDAFPTMSESVSDATSWLKNNGNGAKHFYKHFLSLFLRNGILMENFMLEGTELAFTKEVILPVLAEIREETGMKPLIVALEPTTIEHERFWLSHPYPDMKPFIEAKERLIDNQQ